MESHACRRNYSSLFIGMRPSCLLKSPQTDFTGAPQNHFSFLLRGALFLRSFSFILAWTFISLQIKEFRIMGLSINDSVYSCVFFFLTGLHFFHLLLGLLLLSLLFWSCSFSFTNSWLFLFLCISQIHTGFQKSLSSF